MKEYYIERSEKFLRIAAKDNDELWELYNEELEKEAQPGEIYKGIVKNIVPAIKCAFIDIGYDKHCFMYLDKKFNNLSIKKNDEVIVEILKEATGDKGPKVTNAYTIPGRYVVLETINKTLSFSKKINSTQFKKEVSDALEKPKDIGVMIRTNAEKVSIEAIRDEIEHLGSVNRNLIKEAEYTIKPKLLYRGEGVLDRFLRDANYESISKIFVDTEKDYEYIKSFLDYNKYIHIKLMLHRENKTLFNFYGIERLIIALKENKIKLFNGGSIVIDKTEGMYVIDVNSGGNVKGNNLRDTAYSTNLEAAKEIARQIKLRNLGGIIVIDFIDMQDKEQKDKVMETLKEGFENDKNKTMLYPFTELNLVQIARNHRGKPLSSYIEENCDACRGSGRKLKFSYLKHLIGNDIKGIYSELKVKDIYIEIGTFYKELIISNIIQFVKDVNGTDMKIYVKFIDKLEYYRVEPLIFPQVLEKVQKLKIYG